MVHIFFCFSFKTHVIDLPTLKEFFFKFCVADSWDVHDEDCSLYFWSDNKYLWWKWVLFFSKYSLDINTLLYIFQLSKNFFHSDWHNSQTCVLFASLAPWNVENRWQRYFSGVRRSRKVIAIQNKAVVIMTHIFDVLACQQFFFICAQV